MSNGLLSRKGMIAVLASCMFAITACSDKDKIKDLEGENGQLRDQISKLQDEKTTAEQKLAETEAQVEDLRLEINGYQKTIDEYQNAEGTLADLVKEIDEKKDVVAKLEALIQDLDAQKIAAQEEIAAAEADRKAARIELEEAIQINADAEARIKRIEAQEAALVEMEQKLVEREKVVAASAEQWRKLYSEQRLDAVFDRLTSEGKLQDKLTFQFSVVALNVKPTEVTDIRNKVKVVTDKATNIYKRDKEIRPSTADLALKLTRQRTAESRERRVVKTTMNDSYMAQTTAESIIALRDELNKMNTGGKAVFLVPRLIEKLSVSLDMTVKADQRARLQDAERIRTIFTGKLTEPREIAVDLTKRIDVRAPMQALVSNDSCSDFNAACIEGLAQARLLEVSAGDEYVNLRHFLRTKFRDSADQMDVDSAELRSGPIQVQATSGWKIAFGGSKARQECLDVSTTVERDRRSSVH